MPSGARKCEWNNCECVDIKYLLVPICLRCRYQSRISLRDELYKLRSETKDAFDAEAKALEARWTELQREQKDVYQVLHRILASLS